MDTTWMAKQMIDLQKTVFNNTYSAVTVFQDHAEKTANTLLDQATWIPEEGRMAVGLWSELYKKGQSEVKAAVDENYKRLADCLTGGK